MFSLLLADDLHQVSGSLGVDTSPDLDSLLTLDTPEY
jgi:hypothetical protein